MKKIIYPIIAVVLMSFTLVVKLKDEERTYAQNELTKSMNEVAATVRGLNDIQFNFKPDAETWSVAEIMEHIALSENNIFEMMKGSLNAESEAAQASTMQDAEVIALMLDRSHKVKTFKPFEPSGKFGSFEGSIEAFNKTRKEHIEYILTTDDDLRNHFSTLPFGTLDAYQMVLFMSGHTQRHVMQMKEVIEHPNFPKI